MIFTTPKFIPSCINTIIQKIGGNLDSPIYVPVRRAGGCLVNDCFNNVLKYAHNNDRIIYGWLIWECEELRAFDAIFHAIVETRQNDFVDITPHLDGEQRILFIRDRVRHWNRKPVSAIRYLDVPSQGGLVWLKCSEAVDAFISSCPTRNGAPVINMENAIEASKKLGELAPLFLRYLAKNLTFLA